MFCTVLLFSLSDKSAGGRSGRENQHHQVVSKSKKTMGTCSFERKEHTGVKSKTRKQRLPFTMAMPWRRQYFALKGFTCFLLKSHFHQQ